MSLHSVGTAGT